MDTKQIAFIICANNGQYYEECMRYIQDLVVPKGYQVDTLCIQEAESITQGYNAGMQASEAKYKVYLHQDTFIINRNFIFDVIKIFESDETIGMIGVVGSEKLSADANCSSDWNIGNVEVYDGRIVSCDSYYQKKGNDYIQVQAIQGFIMVTQYDLPWREDVLKGWDYYDISHSLEMGRAGYKVVVPYQEKAWCYHDCGVSGSQSYELNRKRMLLEYPEIFTGKYDEVESWHQQQGTKDIETIRKNLIYLIKNGEYEKLNLLSDEISEHWLKDTQIREITNMMEIYSLEKDSINKLHSIWFEYNNWEEMYECYQWVRFVLMRIEHQREDDRIETMKGLVQAQNISRDAIRKLSNITLESTSNIYECLLRTESEMPLVSVIIALYNGEEFIKDTLDSVLQQTYSNIEVIIIDDASTDRSRENVSAYTDSRIRPVFLEKNYNICYAGNVGFQLATGKYVALIGHDDIWKPDKLEKQIAFLEEHPSYSVCFTWVDIINENGEVTNLKNMGIFQNFCVDNLKQSKFIHKLLLKGNCLCAPSACIRRDFLEQAGYYKYALIQLQDYELWTRLLLQGPIYILQEKLVAYRRFSQEGKNLSSINLDTLNRDLHEKQYIRDEYISKLSSETFLKVFRNDLKNSKAASEKEILCEKAFLLWNMGNCFAEKHFIELLEDEECRDILEEKYQFELKDFYKMNTKPMYFDHSFLYSAKSINSSKQQNEVWAKQLIDAINNNTVTEETIGSYSYYHLAAVLEKCQKLEKGKEYYLKVKTYIENINLNRLRKQEKIVIGFIANFASTWIGDELYNLFEKSDRFEPYVFLLSNHNGQSEALMREEYIKNFKFFQEKDMRVVGTLNLDTGRQYTWEEIGVKPQICIWLTPWITLFKEHFQLLNYSLDTVHTYIPYGFMIAENDKDNFVYDQYNQIIHNVTWKNFEESQCALSLAKKYSFVEGSNAVFTGYPKMDAFYNMKEQNSVSIWERLLYKSGNLKAKKIIFAPHHTLDENESLAFSTFASNYLFILELAQKYQDETVWIFKPHPLLKFKAIKAGLFANEEEWNAYEERWRHLKNGDIMESGSYSVLFMESDAMILDSVSFLAEYLYAHKPLLFLKGNKQYFNEFGKELMKIHYTADGKDKNAVENFIKDIVLSDNDANLEKRERFFERNLDYMKVFGKGAALNIYEQINMKL